MNKEIDAIDAVVRAVDRIKQKGRIAELTLQNGIILTCKPVPPYLASAVTDQFQNPPVPKVWMEEKGRDEENPNDPNYLRMITEIAEKQEIALTNLTLGIGTEVKYVPDDKFGPDDDGWIQGVEFAAKLANVTLDIDRDDKLARYVYWLRYYAIESANDLFLCKTLPAQLSGITESEVNEVLDYFRGLQERGTDLDSEPEAGSENGNRENRSVRRARARNGGT